MEQFEMCATIEWLVWKEKGDTSGCGYVRSLKLCKMVYSMDGGAYVYWQNILPNQ
jgi:hypothetical protein